jgi:predicted O-methyltransferase YrrM
MKTPTEYREMEFVELFIALAKLYKPKIYVELGVKKGYTIKRMAPFVEKAFGVDIAPLALDIPNVTLVQNTTLGFAESLGNRKPFIDMLFIDADHSHDAVMADFTAFFPYVMPGTGLILMHDTHPINPQLVMPGYCDDAWQTAEHLHKSVGKGYEICTLPGPWAGLSIVRKLGKHYLSWM